MMEGIAKFFKSIVSFVVGAVTVVISAVTPVAPTPTPSPTPVPTPTPLPQVVVVPTVTLGNRVKITGTQNLAASNVKYNLEFPSFGGTVTGTFSGICEGKITGIYSYTGGDSGKVTGTVVGACRIPLLPPDLNLKYEGTVNLSSRRIDLSWNGNTPFGPSSGSISIPF